MTLFRRCSIGLVVTLALAGCAEPPPPDTAPQPEPLPEPEPPPPAKCEALSEGCEADAGTEAPIPGTTYVDWDLPDPKDQPIAAVRGMRWPSLRP